MEINEKQKHLNNDKYASQFYLMLNPTFIEKNGTHKQKQNYFNNSESHV